MQTGGSGRSQDLAQTEKMRIESVQSKSGISATVSPLGALGLGSGTMILVKIVYPLTSAYLLGRLGPWMPVLRI